ncbi:MAG: helix-turn-helix domain-containing protein [Chlorobiaceae bacterium]|nr:helix-turn-helix domain-containing protein [Chlorobiaceae bacterium]
MSRSTVIRWISAGHVQAVRLPGGQWRVDVSSLDAWKSPDGRVSEIWASVSRTESRESRTGTLTLIESGGRSRRQTSGKR